MQIKTLEVINSVSVPGTRISGDITINATKQPGVKLTFEPKDGVVYVILNEVVGVIPLSNIKAMVADL